MENENNSNEVTVTDTQKVRKPRSPNKPRTLEKQGLFASKKVDKINSKRAKALADAANRVNKRFDERVAEFVASLPTEVQSLVTGLNKTQTEDEASS